MFIHTLIITSFKYIKTADYFPSFFIYDSLLEIEEPFLNLSFLKLITLGVIPDFFNLIVRHFQLYIN